MPGARMSSTGDSDNIPAQGKADEHGHPTSSICPLHCIVGGLGWLSVIRMYLSPPCTACSKRDSSYDAVLAKARLMLTRVCVHAHVPHMHFQNDGRPVRGMGDGRRRGALR